MKKQNRNPRAILVVESDSHTLGIIRQGLEKPSLLVHSAQSGLEALDHLEKSPADLIIYDEVLAKADGFSLPDRLNHDFRTREIPVLFLEDREADGNRKINLRPGTDDSLAKPFEPLTLLDCAMKVIGRREQQLSMTRSDTLTGLLNRQAIEQEVRQELIRMNRYGKSGSFIFIDVDEFKIINNRFGHSIGDLVLITLAELFRESIRSSDYIGRFDGGKFLFFLSETSAEAAARMAERLMKRFDASDVGTDGTKLTFSAGIVEAPGDGGTDFHLFCERADQALAEAKRTGKAKVVIWNGEMKPGLLDPLFPSKTR